MHRLTARALLVTFLVAIFAPVALAVTAPGPHACCVRKPMHGSVSAEFQATNCAQHDCCRTAVLSHSLQLPRLAILHVPARSSRLHSDLRPINGSTEIHASLSVRAPPSQANL